MAMLKQSALFLSFCCCAQIVMAQGDVFTSTSDYSFAEINPVTLVNPKPPATRFGPGPEGWVRFRFSITGEGRTDNIEMLDFMPPNLPTEDSVRAVENWVFTPASVNGNTIDWHNNIVVINFDLPQVPNFSGPRFTTPYGEVQELMNEGRLNRAARGANNNLRESIYSLHDLGLANVQLALIEIQRENFHLAHQAISHATLPEVSQLSESELDVALQYKFSIELRLGLYQEALNTFDMRSFLVEINEADSMLQQAEQIREAIDQGVTLNARGKVLNEETGWFFTPTLRIFTIADVDGRLNKIKAVCNRNIVELEYQADVEWSLPASWGECSLSVMGRENTTFTLYEFSE